MIKYFKTIDTVITQIEKPEHGCWVSVIAPDENEIKNITQEFELDAGFVKSSLDEEESSRIETEEDQTLIIVDYAITETDEHNALLYSTMPMGIILTAHNVFTISLKENIVLSELSSGIIKNIQTHLKTRFVLHILLRIASKFLQFLKQIDKISYFTERQLHKSMKNKELIQLMDLEKSLVYFSTSLKANEVTLEKILRGRVIKLYEEDQELLEDVLIEVKQAVEMAGIYSSIISGMMEAVGSIINNNMNNVMKRLTIITILMAIPTIIFSYYGMNIPLPLSDYSWVPLGISVMATGIVALILLRK